MGIKENVQIVKNELKDYPNVTVIAATKYIDVDQTIELYKNGINEWSLKDKRTQKY